MNRFHVKEKRLIVYEKTSYLSYFASIVLIYARNVHILLALTMFPLLLSSSKNLKIPTQQWKESFKRLDQNPVTLGVKNLLFID